jgi:polar amino acid transport system substrate-binding protein
MIQYIRRPLRTFALTCAVAIVVASCSSTTATTAPTAPPTAPPTAAVTVAAPPTVAASAVATLPTVPDSALITPGTLTVCQSVPSVPFLMFDANGKVIGTDADTASEIAKRLGLKEASVLSVFATMITSVQTGKCDVIISSMDARADREAQIDQIGYLVTQAGLLFQFGQTHGIGDPTKDPLSVCGHKIIAEIGSQGLDQIKTWSAACTAAGKPAITSTAVQSNDVLYQLLISGQADAAIGGPEPANWYAMQHPNTLQSGAVYQLILEGIGVKKGNTALETAIIATLNSMKADGTLLTIMKKYGSDELGIPKSFDLNPVGEPVLGG